MSRLLELYARAKAAFLKLKPRERYLILAAVGVAVVVVVVFTATAPKSKGPKGKNKLAQVFDRRDEFMAMADEYAGLKKMLDPIDIRMRQRPADFDLYGKINELTDQTEVKPSVIKMDPGTMENNDFLDETYVDVNLQRIDLISLVHFLEKVEQLPGMVRIGQLSVKTRFDQTQTLDAVMRISEYKPRAGGPKLKEPAKPHDSGIKPPEGR